MSDIEKIKYSILQTLSENNLDGMQIQYLLSLKKNNKVEFIAYAVSINDPDIIYGVKVDDKRISLFQVPEWDFNIDDYLFAELEEGYKIENMTLENHYNVWSCVEQWGEEIEHFNGLQSYLSHCQTNGLSNKVMKLFYPDCPNIMDMYKECNQNYSVISSTTIGTKAIVLAENIKAPGRYVTWETTSDRYGGYVSGSYFSLLEDAYKSYKARCETMLEVHLNFDKKRLQNKQNRGQER